MKEIIKITDHFSNILPINKGKYGFICSAINKTNNNRSRSILKVLKKNDKSLTEIECSKLIQKNSHQYLITIFDIFISTKFVYINMEYHIGDDFFDILYNSFKREICPKLPIIAQILQGINHLHNKLYIIHRDIKPENILYYSNHTIKIIDFNLSKILTKSTFSNHRCKTGVGTPFYVSPHVINNDYNYKCDIWSTGIIMYTLYNGIPPFNGDDNSEIIHNITYNTLEFYHPLWDTVPQSIIQLIQSLLSRNENTQPTTKKALALINLIINPSCFNFLYKLLLY